jgi:hypothetical protein
MKKQAENLDDNLHLSSSITHLTYSQQHKKEGSLCHVIFFVSLQSFLILPLVSYDARFENALCCVGRH